MIKNLNSYSWFGELTPEQFSKAYINHQALVQQNRAYSKKCKKHNRKWRKWYFKYINDLKYDIVLKYCRADVKATTNIWEVINHG